MRGAQVVGANISPFLHRLELLAELLGQHNVPQERAADVLVEVLLEDAGEVLRDMQARHGCAVLHVDTSRPSGLCDV